jgi:hypothetical protein
MNRIVQSVTVCASNCCPTLCPFRILERPQCTSEPPHVGLDNPLSLLHTALSEGLHEQHDDVCLELAASIRLVLTELAERMSQVLKDEAELSGAVNKLLNRKGTPKGQLVKP